MVVKEAYFNFYLTPLPSLTRTRPTFELPNDKFLTKVYDSNFVLRYKNKEFLLCKKLLNLGYTVTQTPLYNSMKI